MKAEFYYDHRTYTCSLVQVDFVKELKIKNYQGFVLAIKQGQKIGLLGKARHNAKKIDVSQSHFYNLIKAAMNALELQTRNDLILERDGRIADGEEKIQQQDREIRVLNQQLRILGEQVEHLLAEKQQLTMQLIDNEIRESAVSQEIEDCLDSETDLSMEETENEFGETEISQNREKLAAQLIDDRSHSEIEELEDTEISGIKDEEAIIAFELEAAQSHVEVNVQAGDGQIKRSPKTALNTRMNNKS